MHPCVQEVNTVTLWGKKKKARTVIFYVKVVDLRPGTCCFTNDALDYACFPASFQKGWTSEYQWTPASYPASARCPISVRLENVRNGLM